MSERSERSRSGSAAPEATPRAGEPSDGRSPLGALWPAEWEALRAEVREAGAFVQEYQAARAAHEGSVADRVQAQRAFMDSWIVRSDAGVDREIAGVRCRVFEPARQARGVYLHFHGGGMVVGRPEMSDVTNAEWAERLGIVVVSPDYRLAPEHVHPGGPDDCVAVAAWLLAHGAAEWGAERVVVGGESAGGYLALVTMLRVRDELGAIDRIAGANLVYGVYDWGRTPSQRGRRPSRGPDILEPSHIELFTECYLPARSDDERRDPDASPLYADLVGLAPSLLTVGTADHLFDDSWLLAGRLAVAGSPVELAVYPDCPHGFNAMGTRVGEIANERQVAFLDACLAGA